jgi:hypothetical protein
MTTLGRHLRRLNRLLAGVDGCTGGVGTVGRISQGGATWRPPQLLQTSDRAQGLRQLIGRHLLPGDGMPQPTSTRLSNGASVSSVRASASSRCAPRLVGNWLGARRDQARIQATVVRRAPQVMIKVTGGGRGMRAIAAHFRYISKNGRLDIEDEHGDISRGREAVRDFVEDWRFGGTLIEDVSDRREAYNIMLSMPRGTDPLSVQRAAREFAQAELADERQRRQFGQCFVF